MLSAFPFPQRHNQFNRLEFLLAVFVIAHGEQFVAVNFKQIYRAPITGARRFTANSQGQVSPQLSACQLPHPRRPAQYDCSQNK